MVYTIDEFKSNLKRFSSGLPDDFLCDDIADKLYTVTKELDTCGKLFNLTAITEPEEVLKKHIIDCLFLAREIKHLKNNKFSMLDVGSGAGFPSLPITAVFPEASITALDSTAKKTSYIRATADRMQVKRFTTVTARAEEAARTEMREAYDFAVARAVARLSVLMELCVPFVKPDGYFIAMKGASVEEEEKEAENAEKKLGCTLYKKVPYSIASLPDKRFLLIYLKNSPTSATYPRNYSQISKKPL